jgi:hypothetical protein
MKTLFGLQVDDWNYLPRERLVRNGDISENLLESVISEIVRNHTASPPIIGDVNDAIRRVFISSIIYAVVSSFDGDVKIFPEYEVSGSYGKGSLDWIIKVGDIIICVSNDISHGIGQSSVQAHASMQRNRKKRAYADADLYDEEMFCIISTGMLMKQNLKRFKMMKYVNILTPLIFLTPGIEWIITKVILKSNDYDENNDGIVEVRLCLPWPDPIPINKPSLTCDDIREPVRKLLMQIKGLIEEQRNTVINVKRRRTWK